MSDHVEKVRKALRDMLPGGDIARALDAAGLLRTGIEQRACDACEKYAAFFGDTVLIPRAADVRSVGREIVESRKLKERYVAMSDAHNSWKVQSVHDSRYVAWGTEAECRVVAEALNKLEA